jgi:hypothetical protein
MNEWSPEPVERPQVTGGLVDVDGSFVSSPEEVSPREYNRLLAWRERERKRVSDAAGWREEEEKKSAEREERYKEFKAEIDKEKQENLEKNQGLLI